MLHFLLALLCGSWNVLRTLHLMPETTFWGALRQQMCFDSSVSFWGAGRMSDGFHTVPLNFKQARHSFEFRGIISVTTVIW